MKIPVEFRWRTGDWYIQVYVNPTEIVMSSVLNFHMDYMQGDMQGDDYWAGPMVNQRYDSGWAWSSRRITR